MCGTVHEAINKSTEERVAIKIIDTKKFALTPGLSPHDLREEAEMMKNLNHPNIIRYVITHTIYHIHSHLLTHLLTHLVG